MHTVGPGILQENLKKENETQTQFDLDYGEKHSKTQKMSNAHCRTCSMARKLKIMENDKQTLQDLKYVQKNKTKQNKTRKNLIMRNAHYRTWSIKRKLKIIENEKHTWQDEKYVEND